jgi:RDD family
MRWTQEPVHTEDSVSSPRAPDRERLRDAFFAAVRGLTLGFLRGEQWRLKLGPLTVHEFGEPAPTPDGWSWPILGGLLARRAGGTLRYEWRRGRLVATVDGYWPTLPRPIYRATQLRLHHLITRIFLLQLRGRVPPAGIPAGPAQRLAAGGLDLAACAGASLLLPRRLRLRGFAGILLGYHLAAWTLSGRTLGGRVLGLRLVSVDGSPVTLPQALVRLAALPPALARFRAVHDELALTEVIEDTQSRGR